MLIKSGSISGELVRMKREMERILDRISNESVSSAPKRDWSPSLDLIETKDSLVAELEVPGINPDAINISANPDLLTVSGEKKQKGGDQEKNYHIRERAHGRFSRSIPLPIPVNPDQVEARYIDGILRVTMEKSQATTSKKIEVKTA